MAKKFDLAVKVGSYTDREGKEKNKWQNIGVILDGKYGDYMLLNRHFNPAGVPCDPSNDVITVSMFDPKGRPAAVHPAQQGDVNELKPLTPENSADGDPTF